MPTSAQMTENNQGSWHLSWSVDWPVSSPPILCPPSWQSPTSHDGLYSPTSPPLPTLPHGRVEEPAVLHTKWLFLGFVCTVKFVSIPTLTFVPAVKPNRYNVSILQVNLCCACFPRIPFLVQYNIRLLAYKLC